MRHVSPQQLVALAEGLSPQRWKLLRAVGAVRLASAGQLYRRFYGGSATRQARRDLAALHEIGVLHRLERRVGGVRAGSSGFIYALGPVGLRLLEYSSGEGVERGRSRYEPTAGFVEHALAVTEVWVGLHEYIESPWTQEKGAVIEFCVERDAWRSYVDGFGAQATLKPDAELRVETMAFEDRWWVEVDRATERRGTIAHKLKTYVAYFQSGREQRSSGVFPLTAWLTTTEERAEVLREVIAGLPRREQQLFRVGLLSAASPFLMSEGRHLS